MNNIHKSLKSIQFNHKNSSQSQILFDLFQLWQISQQKSVKNNKNINKLQCQTSGMSSCHFPQDNYTIILDMPSISNINHTLQLIQTHQHIAPQSILSFSCFDKQTEQQPTCQLLKEDDEEDSLGVSLMQGRVREDVEEEMSTTKKKKTGCTCKKTNCIKMYCQCFSIGKMCTPDCACYGCYNHYEHTNILTKAKQQLKGRSLNNNRHNHKGCNCKKTNCQKKYCECYNAGLACTEACNCCDCCNKQTVEEEKSGEDSVVSVQNS